MSKKCSHCGFMNNTNDAHYGGKCGYKFEYFSNWKVYDSAYYTAVDNGTLNNYRRYEQQVKKSWLIDPWGKLKKWWDDSKEGIIFTLGFTGIVVIVAVGWALLFPNGCSSSEKKLARIEVDGKYGIGYAKDHLLVPAKYASISEQPIGANQWLIYDPATGKMGLAYVTDSIQGVIEPTLEDVKIGYGRYSLLRTIPKDVRHYDEYQYVVKDGKILNKQPFTGIKPVGRFNDFTVFLDRQANNQYQLYNPDLNKIGSEYNSVNISDPDEVIIARGRNVSVLYDFTGNRATDKSFRYIKNFSDGVSWAYLTKNDYVMDRVTLIDRNGKSFFSVDAAKNSVPVDFSEGIGWYKNTKGMWVAIDKSGKEQFTMGAYTVYPFTMGLAPVFKGTNYHDRKLGFVDKTGRMVIPFKYETSVYPPKFLSDSTVTVTLDGKTGKLHWNGTFYPGK